MTSSTFSAAASTAQKSPFRVTRSVIGSSPGRIVQDRIAGVDIATSFKLLAGGRMGTGCSSASVLRGGSMITETLVPPGGNQGHLTRNRR